MKKNRILALFFAVALIFTCFSTSFVFAENDEGTGEELTATENPDAAPAEGEEGTEGEGGEGGEEGGEETPSDRTAFMVEDLTQVDPTASENNLLLAAANKAADGREVTVYNITLEALMAVESSSNDFVGVGVYKEDDSTMTLLEPSYEGKPFTYYDIEEGMVGVAAYYLEVSSIAESEIQALQEPADTPEKKAERLVWKQEKRGLFKSADQRIRAMTKYYDDGKVALYADDQLAEICVHDIVNNEYYFSTPYDYRRVAGVSSNETKNQIASFMELTYYDNSANEKSLYSYTDAVAKTAYADPNDKDAADNIQFSTEAIENGVRFNFEIGTKQVDSLLPYAAETTRFETKVLQPLEQMEAEGNALAKKALTKLNAYYKRYHYEDLTVSLQESIAKNYPGIKDYDFYIIRPTVDREKAFLSDYVKLAGQYTWEDYYDDLEISGYIPPDVALACFDIKVDITIENGDLVINMPTENIKYDTESFTLAKVTLLRYFGCGSYDDDSGFIFIPDGCGSVINFNLDGSKDSNMVKPMYGDDYSLTTSTSFINLSQTAYLPVYGLRSNARAYLAILEKGDALATVYSESGNKTSNYETAYATFVYNTVQRITYDDSSKQNGDFTYYNENTYKDGFRLRFKLLNGKDVSYVDMAKTYRQYLLDNGKLTKSVAVDNKNVPLVLETLGLIDKTASFLGIVYDKKIPLTTFKDAQDMLTELKDNGVKNVSLRYRGWMNGGLNYSVPSKLNIEKKLGGKNGFSDLVSFMKNNQFDLFPEVDFCVVRRDGVLDGYRTTSDAPKMTDRTTVTLTPRRELDNVMKVEKNYFAISPSAASKYYNKFFKKYNTFGNTAVSLGTVGDMLYSDFASGKSAANRQQAVDLLYQNVDTYVTGGQMTKVMVEGGNAYSYKFATDIVDIPLCDSNTFLADSTVPFMQIVLHGHVRYAGAALNLSDDMTDTILKSAEYGANLHFTLSAKNTRELKETVYSNYFTIDFDTWKGDIFSLYSRFNDVFAGLQDQEITDHEAVADVEGVYITTYESGTRIAVNYNRNEVTVEGKTIAAQDFTVL